MQRPDGADADGLRRTMIGARDTGAPGDRRDPFLSNELLEFRSSLRGFLNSRLDNATVLEWERAERYPRELMAELAEWGLHGVLLPAEVGGDAGGALEMALICEELGRFGGSVAAPFMTTVTAGAKLVEAGAADPLKREVLSGVASGTCRLAIAISEPGAGSDVGAIQTRATRTNGGWMIEGEKTWCTGALEATYIVVLARTSERGTRGLTAFLVDGAAEGLDSTPIPKLGHSAIQTCTVALSGVGVPDGAVLGEVDQGWALIGASLMTERLTLAAQAVGLTGRVVELSQRYAAERTQFGRRLIDIQAVAHKLADMVIAHDAARLMTYRAAWAADRGDASARSLSAAKVFASEAAMDVAHQGLQLHGGYGYATEYEVERHFRDAKLLEIVGGTSEVQRNLIAQDLGAGAGVFTYRTHQEEV